jgi:hypothetical protein
MMFPGTPLTSGNHQPGDGVLLSDNLDLANIQINETRKDHDREFVYFDCTRRTPYFTVGKRPSLKQQDSLTKRTGSKHGNS